MTMNLIPGVESTGSALSAEKIRLEIIAQNIANSNTTQDADGNVYKRKEVAFEEFVKTPERRIPGYVDENLYQGVRVTDVFDDQRFHQNLCPIQNKTNSIHYLVCILVGSF